METYEKQLAILRASDSQLTVCVNVSAILCHFYTAFSEGLERAVYIKCFSLYMFILCIVCYKFRIINIIFSVHFTIFNPKCLLFSYCLLHDEVKSKYMC
jgi:hypothetical protein